MLPTAAAVTCGLATLVVLLQVLVVFASEKHGEEEEEEEEKNRGEWMGGLGVFSVAIW